MPTHLVNVDVPKGGLGLIAGAAPRDPTRSGPVNPHMPMGLVHKVVAEFGLPATSKRIL